MAKQFVSRKVEEQKKEAEQRGHAIKQDVELEKKKKKTTMIMAVGIVLILLIAATAYGVSSYYSPGPYDNFAKCLSQKGVIIYGADWCEYTNAQKAMFGKSFKYIDYKIYDKGPNIKVTPTWEINGQLYERVQSFERLSTLTGCSIN